MTDMPPTMLPQIPAFKLPRWIGFTIAGVLSIGLWAIIWETEALLWQSL